ncbi:Ground-like domain-containing protein [Caenorhabditis elegans]|uniref:Ground-like domain-containing protein n=1 Tax=Caenorhabditis elegans TaxID=6239 RepID=Q19120_CAEEL|nr:Ground-like domain-containing protein [Caenorhabditis elegans]CAB01646.1 Ground-like domain-containing protein [Caenorhabditis elegans]|eukprot:NP_506682.1 GRounDhog (hedgehog-like family) [Caenorhabditis elegans]
MLHRPKLTVILSVLLTFRLADCWFLSMLGGGAGGCQNQCPPAYSGYYQSRNYNPPQQRFNYGLPPPTPPANSYATAPANYAAPSNAYPFAPQYSIPMNSYAMPKYAVAPQYAMVPYPTPPAYVRPPPVYVTPPPVYITPPPTTTTTIPPPKCFQNTQGYKCCNRQLDQFLEQKVGEMLKPEWQRCNLQRFATQLQHETQQMFNHSMEAIVASGEVQNLSNYRGDLYCKKRSRDGKIVVIYGSAVPYSLDTGVTRPMNDDELRTQMYPAKYDEIGVHDGHEENIWF